MGQRAAAGIFERAPGRDIQPNPAHQERAPHRALMAQRPMHLTDISPLFIIDAILLPVCRSLYNLSNNELSSVSYRLHSQPRTEFIICSISKTVYDIPNTHRMYYVKCNIPI